MLNTKKSLITLVATGLILSSTHCYAISKEDITDKATQNRVAIRMVLNECVPSSQVDVHVNNGIIQFAGFVDNGDQYNAVQNIADKYANDHTVINNVRILSVKDNRHDEARLRDDVIRQLKDYKYPVDNMDVQARNGHVILSGFVNKHVSLKDVKRITKNVPGVKEVDNYLLYKKT